MALSRAVALAVETSGRPKPVHGVEAIASKFWSSGDSDSESAVDEDFLVEENSISTSEFISEAAAAGFTVQNLQQAEQELSSTEVRDCSTSVSKGTAPPLAKRIIDAMVQRKTHSRPWQGPLPPPRVSPPKTLGDAFVSARWINGAPSRRGSTFAPAVNSKRGSDHCSSSLKAAKGRGSAQNASAQNAIPFCLSPASFSPPAASSDEDQRLAGSIFLNSISMEKLQATNQDSQSMKNKKLLR